jgi:1-deoxy-D-xylulose-5-phosphate synthase
MGRVLCERAKSDGKICAITAAMCDGTGLTEFAATYPDRFFDVGIAEEHAVTFAGGLALQGMKPVLILYSTFAQRSFDQLFHDISIQKLPLVLALDRSGIVSGDGVTHQGIFDYALFSTLPNVTIYSPESYEDLSNALDKALLAPELSIVRYPKGGEDVAYETEDKFMLGENGDFSYTQGVENADVVLLSYGRISRQAYEAMKILREKHTVGLIKLKKIFPLDFNALSALMKNAKLVYVLEEGMKQGGVVEKLALGLGALLPKTLVHERAIEEYVQHGSLSELMQECGFNATQVALDVENALGELDV